MKESRHFKGFLCRCITLFVILLDVFRSRYAGVDASRGGQSDLWRRRRRRDHGADSEVGNSGSGNQSPAQREEEVQSQPQVM